EAARPRCLRSRRPRDFRHRPQYYEELFAVNLYLDRDYPPLDERARRLPAHEQAALTPVASIRKELVSPPFEPGLETAVKTYKGYAEYLRGDVAKLLANAGDAAFRSKFAATNEALAKVAQDLAEHLKSVELPKGDASHVLGRDKYVKLLEAQEGLTSN